MRQLDPNPVPTLPIRVLRALALALALSGLSVQAEVRVGAPFALSGPVAEQSKAMRAGAELAEQQVNAQGGVLGQPLRLLFADTGCDADRGVTAVRQLIESGVVALVGPVCSGVTLRQARSVSIPAGVATLSVASASALITALADQDLVFRTAPSDALKGQALARQAQAMGMARIAVSHASDAYNTGVAQAFVQAFTALGGQVVVQQAHQPKQADYSGEAGALAAAASDVALFAYSGSGGVTYLKPLLADARVRRVLGTDGLMSAELAAQLGAEALARLSFVLAAADTEREGYKRWQAMAASAQLKADGPYVAHAYDAAFMMALAIEAAGSADKARVAAGLRAISGPKGAVIYPGEFAKARALLQQGQRINYDGASGPVDFDAAGDIVGRFSLNRYSQGAWQSVLVQ